VYLTLREEYRLRVFDISVLRGEVRKTTKGEDLIICTAKQIFR
jgi:hypothetical protein